MGGGEVAGEDDDGDMIAAIFVICLATGVNFEDGMCLNRQGRLTASPTGRSSAEPQQIARVYFGRTMGDGGGFDSGRVREGWERWRRGPKLSLTVGRFFWEAGTRGGGARRRETASECKVGFVRVTSLQLSSCADANIRGWAKELRPGVAGRRGK